MDYINLNLFLIIISVLKKENFIKKNTKVELDYSSFNEDSPVRSSGAT